MSQVFAACQRFSTLDPHEKALEQMQIKLRKLDISVQKTKAKTLVSQTDLSSASQRMTELENLIAAQAAQVSD